ncbi:MAG: undecaprenyl-phosphate mannosyltransferase [Firmicutes bacterium]|nr:undecaprenyl-phosphate mannosyltransferase [Bacillota bacterium]
MELIIIPTYNECNNLERLLSMIYKETPDIHVLIVDDNSPDGTGELVKTLIQKRYSNQLFLLERSGKQGLGTAYIVGFKWALKRSYKYIFEMDGDFSHNPKYLKNFIVAIKKCDVVLGSRYVHGGGIINWNFFRRIISYGGSLYSRMFLGMPLNDITGGFKCFDRKVLEQIPLDNIQSNGMSFQIEMTYRAFLQGFIVKEMPIVFEERATGKSKISVKIFMEAVFMVWKLRFKKASFSNKNGWKE